MENNLLPTMYKILEIIPQSSIEHLFRMEYDQVEKINYGQFLQVSIPKVGEAPISISNFDREKGTIDLLIRRVGKVTDGIFTLKPGDKMGLRGPYGNGFPYKHYKGKNMIIVGGGSGVAPVRSMIDHVYYHPEEVPRLEVLLGYKNEDTLLFKEDITRWEEKIPILITLDDCPTPSNYLSGRVTEHIDKLSLLKEPSNHKDVQIVIVGPPIMMKFTTQAFLKYNIPEENIWLSFERNMSCAVGKCGHCKINETYVCLDGPIFNYQFSKQLID